MKISKVNLFFVLAVFIFLIAPFYFCRAEIFETNTINWVVYTNNGTINSSAALENLNGMLTAKKGSDLSINFIPDGGYDRRLVEIDGVEMAMNGDSYTFYNLESDHTVAVGFFTNSTPVFTITPAVFGNGKIIPSGAVAASQGQTVTYRFIPNRGYGIPNSLIDGIARTYVYINGIYYGPEDRVIFSNLSVDHTLSVDFGTTPVSHQNAYRTLEERRLWQSGMTVPEKTISPVAFEYKGAFKVPTQYADFNGSWNYHQGDLTYCPSGDPNGSADGYPGSIFGLSHIYGNMVTEISIPEPIISPAKNISDLNRANILQEAVKVDAGNLDSDSVMNIGGLVYMPPKAGQTSGKLYWGKGKHFPDNTAANHGWSETDLTSPNSAGLWRIGNIPTVNTGYIMFEIPQNWADAHAGGKSLATGRDRWGQGIFGHGPSIYAIAPWLEGNPPDAQSSLSYIPLIQYGTDQDQSVNGYSIADVWGAGEWIVTDNQSAIVFSAQVSYGNIWYGNNGPNTRGCYGNNRKIVFIFYDPSDLAKVAHGQTPAYYPQPYATLDITPHLYKNYATWSIQQSGNYFGLAYDRTRNFLYLSEYGVDGDRPIIHVYKIKDNVSNVSPKEPAKLVVK